MGIEHRVDAVVLFRQRPYVHICSFDGNKQGTILVCNKIKESHTDLIISFVFEV